MASDGRTFATYTRGEYEYTLGVIVNKTAERPYPSAELNLPPTELHTTWNGIPFGSGNSSGLISVQAIYITSKTSSRPLVVSFSVSLLTDPTRQSTLAHKLRGKYISLNGVRVTMALLESLADSSECAKGLFELQGPRD